MCPMPTWTGLISIKMLALHPPSEGQRHGGVPTRRDRPEIIRLMDAGNISSVDERIVGDLDRRGRGFDPLFVRGLRDL
jgi:hypothetical protein